MTNDERAVHVADSLRARFADQIIGVVISVRPTKHDCALLDITLPDGDGFLVEVSNRSETVRVLDPHDEALSEAELLEYVAARASGDSATDSIRAARASSDGPS
ncbi:MAG TPA: hypothetical protein VK662_00085 [Acidothermaceae bacterium]|nr:hypothetical protein [Acidothermaceae bacterium]